MLFNFLNRSADYYSNAGAPGATCIGDHQAQQSYNLTVSLNTIVFSLSEKYIFWIKVSKKDFIYF